MLKMLIVDDEKFERAGVKSLVRRYNLELQLYEAESGEEALEIVKDKEIDILFSDIRMNGMDGLVLAEKVNALNRSIKIIFMSAYGEFEYAKRAIDLKVIRFILKPVQVSEFLTVLSQVIQLCREERRTKEEQEHLRQAYRHSVRYRKQKLLYALVRGGDEAGEGGGRPIIPFDDFRFWYMAMLDTRHRFFDLHDFDFEQGLHGVLPGNFEVVHMNDRQCLILFETAAEFGTDELTALGRCLIESFCQQYKRELYVVMSGLIENMDRLQKEFAQMETMLENVLFYDKNTVMFTHYASFSSMGISDFVEETLGDIKQNVRRKQFAMARIRFEQLYDALQNSEHFSVLYVKYVCMEIVKAAFESSTRKKPERFGQQLEDIYKTVRLSELRDVMLSIFGEHEPGESGEAESGRKVIEDVVRIVEGEFATELSVEGLAERVFLTPNYLSHLFKKHKGVGLTKYITMYRLERALQLLEDTNMKVTDISEKVGYENFPYFCSLFKNYYGKTPTQYREETGI